MKSEKLEVSQCDSSRYFPVSSFKPHELCINTSFLWNDRNTSFHFVFSLRVFATILKALWRYMPLFAHLKPFLRSESLARKMSGRSKAVDYSGWSKSDLLRRIHQLEGNDCDPILNVYDGKKKHNLSEGGPVMKKQKKQKVFDFSKYSKRKIALRFSYLGWNYQGLALQGEPTELPTVEEKLMDALFRVKLIGSLEQQECEFSRCGRTDKGVSALNQVVSLNVRSKLTAEELKDPANDRKEIDYIKSINQALPNDIRVHSICLRVPKDFDARFSCTFRHYKYVFHGKDLDIAAMNEAASYFVGENDFRNFCKIDASKQITNFKRTIMMAQIDKIENQDGFYVFNLKGTAFLWHQVRCMVAVLLTVAQKLEDPTIDLLQVEEYSSRPTYKMAHDIPLVLYDCGFDEEKVKWSRGPMRNFNTNAAVDGLWNDYKVKSIMLDFMRSFTDTPFESSGKVHVNLGDGVGQAMKDYIKYNKRSRLETADQINAKWKGKKDASRAMSKAD